MYVKDKGFNLNTMIVALKFIISCDILGLAKSFYNSCFGHAFSNAYQYVSIDEIFYKFWNMDLSKLPNLTYRNTEFGWKNQGRENKNGIKVIQIWIFFLKNEHSN